MTKQLRCAACHHSYVLAPLFQGCPTCGGTLEKGEKAAFDWNRV